MKTIKVLCVCALVVVLAGCRATMSGSPPTAAEPMPVLVRAEIARQCPVFGGDGREVQWNALVDAAAGAEVVILGEQHGQELGLSTAAALWRDVLGKSPKAALALEFFDRDEQAHVDDFVTGVSDEATFLKRTGRAPGPDGRPSSNFLPGHRDMVVAAKEAHVPVIAGNAPRAYVRVARTDGYDKLATLTDEQRRLFRVPDELPGAESKYRKDFEALMGGDPSHAGKGTPEEKQAKLDATFRSQSLWDWTMADSLATAVRSGRGPVVQVVGQFHCDHRGGLVQALEHLRSGTRVVTVSFQDAPGTSLREEDNGRADFVVYVGK